MLNVDIEKQRRLTIKLYILEKIQAIEEMSDENDKHCV